MESFFLGYRDPLVGFIVFFALIFIISFFSYWWAIYQHKKESRTIFKFFGRFVPSKEMEQKEALLQLAKAYEKRGDYKKAISLLQELLQGDSSEDLRILGNLADLYFQAGFLQRSKEIYEQILKIRPRERSALKHLLIVYELLEDFDGCFDVLESLEELGEEGERGYIKAKYFAKRKDITSLAALYEKGEAKRTALEAIFRLDSSYAWSILKEEDILLVIDILWYLPKARISLHLPLLKELYSAKGYVHEATSSKIFELDLLLHYPKADLEFEYLCMRCKKRFPLPFGRCPNCQSTESLVVEKKIVKKEFHEKSLPL